MSINSAMLAGVSGLVANSSALAAISDNIANVNTIGYKRNQVDFMDMVTSQAAAGRYSAGGVQGVTRQFVSQQGLIQSATSTTDLAISGDVAKWAVESWAIALGLLDPLAATVVKTDAVMTATSTLPPVRRQQPTVFAEPPQNPSEAATKIVGPSAREEPWRAEEAAAPA